jgi:type III secretion system FlhB-like substrate exporter
MNIKRLLLLLALAVPYWVWAQSDMVTGRATPLEVYQKVAEAAQFLAKSGEKGLKEFENPRGRFVWKDTFVWVTECEKNYCLPTPKSQDLGLSLSQMKCHQTGKLYILGLCDDMAAHPEGAWVEHWQPRPGFEQPQRKVSFMMQVPNSPYQVVSDIFDDTATLEQLNKISKQ